MTGTKFRGGNYDNSYREFNSPLSQQVRREAYGRDIGQHSWVTVEELEEDIERLKVASTTRLLDLGCGPGGPLTFILSRVGCHGSGVDVSAEAIAAGRARAATLQVERLVTFQEADLNAPLPFANGSFDAVISLDVILHLRDRAAVFREVARTLSPGRRFLFTDAGVITGAISDEEVRLRSVRGNTQFVPPGFNERMLEAAGFRLIDRNDRTASSIKNAAGRLAARLAHRVDLEKTEGLAAFEREQQYLEAVLTLAKRGALSRMAYLAESPAA